VCGHGRLVLEPLHQKTLGILIGEPHGTDNSFHPQPGPPLLHMLQKSAGNGRIIRALQIPESRGPVPGPVHMPPVHRAEHTAADGSLLRRQGHGGVAVPECQVLPRIEMATIIGDQGRNPPSVPPVYAEGETDESLQVPLAFDRAYCDRLF
jgi:hypothetical protein